MNREGNVEQMQCSTPIYLKKNQMSAPCGKCPQCKIAYSREWAIRVMLELPYHNGKAVFITLTYKNEDIKNVHKWELQNYIKRLKERLKPRKIQYLGCGEYGKKNGKPHYHIIAMGVTRKDFTYLFTNRQGNKIYKDPSWEHGHIGIGDVNYQSSRYIANYILKDQHEPTILKVQDYELNRPFKIQSNGMGKKHALEKKGQILKDLCIRYQGQKYSIPRYFLKVYNLDTNYKNKISERKKIEMYKKYKDKGYIIQLSEGVPVGKLQEELYRERRQKLKNLKARMGLKTSKY